MKKLNVECECNTSVMGHFAEIERQAAHLKALMVEAGMDVAEPESGAVYDENGDLDRTAADYADAPASVTE